MSPVDRSPSAQSGGFPPDRKIVGGDQTPPNDPRLAAFAEFLAAVDRLDTPATLTTTRRLRRLGLSVLCLGTPRSGGGR